jgi:xylose isomerase
MERKFAANAGFFGLRRDRFVQYQPQRTLAEKFQLVASVEGVRGIELKFPGDFQDLPLVRTLMEKHNLLVPVINVDTKDVDHFRYGALSGRSAKARTHAATLLKEAMDLAPQVGAEIVTTCPLADGYDYPFQIDYTTGWGYFVDTVRTAATHRPDVKLLLEYQPHEPHAKILLSNVGKAIYACSEVGTDNVGVNLDIGHSFAAGESPAESAALLAGKGFLRYIHSNDNTGDGGDWDMISGSVHLWEWVELLDTLRRLGYSGWIGADIAPKHIGAVAGYTTNFLLIRRMSEMLDRIGMGKIAELLKKDANTPEVYELLSSALVPRASK